MGLLGSKSPPLASENCLSCFLFFPARSLVIFARCRPIDSSAGSDLFSIFFTTTCPTGNFSCCTKCLSRFFYFLRWRMGYCPVPLWFAVTCCYPLWWNPWISRLPSRNCPDDGIVVPPCKLWKSSPSAYLESKSLFFPAPSVKETVMGSLPLCLNQRLSHFPLSVIALDYGYIDGEFTLFRPICDNFKPHFSGKLCSAISNGIKTWIKS